MQITLGPQYNVGEKPTVILYIYINRHAGTPENINRSPLVGHFLLIFSFFSEKNPVYRDRTHVSTCQKITRLLLSYRGDRVLIIVLVFYLDNCVLLIPIYCIKQCKSIN